jgi:hypothetical protein
VFYESECRPIIEACDVAEKILGHPLRPVVALLGDKPMASVPVCWKPLRDPDYL